MNNFKSGAGNLDFGSSSDDEQGGKADETTGAADTQDPPEQEQSTSAPSDDVSSETEGSSQQPESNHNSTEEAPAANPPPEQYPYFVRRSNVGDERDTRLEVHVRDKVANQEAQFRNELAEQLGASEISKTDAREFALLAAFHHPERVAELMRDEGFGTLS